MNTSILNAKKIGILSACIGTLIYLLIITFIFMSSKNLILLYSFIASPVVFICFYTFGYSLKAGYIKFLKPSNVREAYDNPVDNYTRSEFDKDKGSWILAIACFLPMFIFYLLFAWIFYLRSKINF